ncbi:MAG TPA: hypothetical protein VGS80_03200 [Ktedonobacterales bacterium]|nr:hypothetical protein [Ktedonobacterales bacterium]
MVGNAKRWGVYGVARNIALARLLENFLVAAVASMLAIRFYLTLTGFPQLGGAGLHIAHLLWGGLFMLVALVLLLAFLGRRVKYVAAVLGGIGFGTFIDELGKFITSDNNYFFKPTVAIVYIVFVLLFALSWLLERPRFSQRERIANALDEVKEVVLRGGDPTEVSEVVRMVHAAGPTPDPLLLAVAEAVERVQPTTAPPKLGDFARFAARCAALYRRVVASRPFQAVLIVAFLAYVIAAAGLLAVEAVTRAASAVVHAVAPDFFQEITGAGTSLFVLRALFVSFALSAALAAIGLVSLRRSRLSAHRWFKRSILVSIFLVQVFLFYSQQLEALTGLTVNLVALVALNTIIAAERHTLLRATLTDAPLG